MLLDFELADALVEDFGVLADGSAVVGQSDQVLTHLLLLLLLLGVYILIRFLAVIFCVFGLFLNWCM